jgi:hypothetical protein
MAVVTKRPLQKPVNSRRIAVVTKRLLQKPVNSRRIAVAKRPVQKPVNSRRIAVANRRPLLISKETGNHNFMLLIFTCRTNLQ